MHKGIETLPRASVIPVKFVGQVGATAALEMAGLIPAAATGVVTDISLKVTVWLGTGDVLFKSTKESVALVPATAERAGVAVVRNGA